MSPFEIIICIIGVISVVISISLMAIFIRSRKKADLQHNPPELRLLLEEMARNREESSSSARMAREELSSAFRMLNETMISNIANMANLQKNQLDIFSGQLNTLTQSNEQRLEALRKTLEEKIKSLQDDNSQKLEAMRATVDEKLASTLEKRLGESFKLVSERLEQVYKGLGEMQVLASGVGDLKKVLMNVKTRGVWGEIQLGNILEQILTPDQFVMNVVTAENSSERVEFAVRLPGKGDDGGEILLPIDAKFPNEIYQRLVEASEQSNPALIAEAQKQLETRIKEEARRICDKYINPPHTTDFAIMFLPTEGLYAEVVKQAGLMEHIQDNSRVVIAGPSTMAALLNSLSIGFRTLAIQKRSGEVWTLLGAIKAEFGKFGAILEKTQKKLQDASNTIDEAARRSRMIEKKLRKVEEVPYGGTQAIIEETTGSSSSDENFEAEAEVDL